MARQDAMVGGQAEMASKHQGEGVTDFSNCSDCYPTGQKEEGGDRGGGGDN